MGMVVPFRELRCCEREKSAPAQEIGIYADGSQDDKTEILVKARTDAYLINQASHLRTPSTGAPFPLAVLTCIGIEMIGSYAYGDARNDRNDLFKKIVEDMDSGFSREHLTPDGKQKKLGYFVYEGFRNSLAHGYYGRWVFITHDKGKVATFRYSSAKQVLVLNVYWFHEAFCQRYDQYFLDLLSADDATVDSLKTFNETKLYIHITWAPTGCRRSILSASVC